MLMYLDYEIRQRFKGNVQSQPAHIYARSLIIEPGLKMNAGKLASILQQRGYSHVRELEQPGEFLSTENAMDVFVRAFDNNSLKQGPVAARIVFQGNRVASLVAHSNAENLEQLVVEPQLIGKFNIKEGKTVQGGSTLTQQLVKNLFLTPQRTFTRKATEAVMAVLVELRFSKADILELYLNEIFLGQAGNRAVHGFALASEHYFGKPLGQLKLHETTLLVGIIPGPSYYNPRRHPERALRRRNLVLRALVDVGAINEQTAEVVSRSPLGVIEQKSRSAGNYPAYIDYLHRQLRQYYSEEVLRTNGLKLYTSLDVEVQEIAQKGLTETLVSLEQLKGLPAGTLQGAVVVIEPALGEILAMVGDRVRGFSGFNRAIDAERPIGSLVKPAVYLTALAQPDKFSLVTSLDDSPITITASGGEPWSPQNYDRKFRGPVPLYEALIHSYNLPTVRLGMDIGVNEVVETMHRLGINREIAEFPSTLLGASAHSPLEIAQIYQTIANSGVRIPLRSIQNIHNNRGESIARFPLSQEQVFDTTSIYLIDFTLRQVVAGGTAAGLLRTFGPDYGIAGKTGTTDEFRDSWFAGYSRGYLTVVWVGRDDNQPIHLSGSSGAMRVWESVMSRLDVERFPLAENKDIVAIKIDPQSGLVANHRCAGAKTVPFIRGYEPEDFAPCSGLTAQLKSWFNIQGGVISAKPESFETRAK
jgi:penicillin-binding protein 1B